MSAALAIVALLGTTGALAVGLLLALEVKAQHRRIEELEARPNAGPLLLEAAARIERLERALTGFMGPDTVELYLESRYLPTGRTFDEVLG